MVRRPRGAVLPGPRSGRHFRPEIARRNSQNWPLYFSPSPEEIKDKLGNTKRASAIQRVEFGGYCSGVMGDIGRAEFGVCKLKKKGSEALRSEIQVRSILDTSWRRESWSK